MKTLKKLTALVLLFALSFGINAQNYENERLNLPGDNLNLYAVMDLFQESETLEGFERNLNAADAKVNNLDLNGDNLIDYIKVLDYVDGTTHTIVLQVAINKRENQDVAVFTVYRDKYDQVQIQLVGDEYLYGKNYIIEPYYAETPNPGYSGNTQVVSNQPAVTTTTYIQVRTWPVVRYIYTPTYVVYRSPWYWNYYPTYWNPWSPYYYDYYYGYHSHWHNHYYGHYRHTNHYHNHYYVNNYYNDHRSYSTTVNTYHNSGRYDNTYSRPDLRTKGSDEGRRVYASNPGRVAGRADSDVRQGSTTGPRVGDAGRTSTPTTGRTTTPTNGREATPATGRTSTPTTGRESTPAVGRTITPTTGRTSTPAADRTATPTVGRESTPAPGRTVTPAAGRTTTPTIGRESTPSTGRISTPSTGRTSTPAVSRPATQAKPSSSVSPRQTAAPAQRQEVSRPKTQAPARSESKPAVRSTESRSSSPTIRPTESRSSEPRKTSTRSTRNK